MDLITILIAFSLAMDSFSVSITRGFTNPQPKMVAEALKVGVFFGLFQAIMPIIGWLAGVNFIDFISDFDHWIAFGLLTFIGVRMIYESTKTESRKIVSSSSMSVLFMMSIATSIDALAVGLSYSFLEVSIVTPSIVIGVITFSLSFLGVFIGNKFGSFFEKIGLLGGLILIGIGIKILTEHMGVFT
ncbi:MAG: manganese efflux pump [Candidatus Bathyarchaeota archaeon]|nr:MAG: manganese efflux pump [Candidatus Bathyarchaeota archaeon]